MVLDNFEDPAANPGSKRPRSEPSYSDGNASAAGKGGTKIMMDWAAPKLTEAADALYREQVSSADPSSPTQKP